MTDKQLEIQADAIGRARGGMSTRNYAPIFAGFKAKGIAPDDIRPRENVLTFHAWKAVGRSVRKGEHGVTLLTWVPRKGRTDDPTRDGLMPKTTVVFHVSQTDPMPTR